MPNRHGSSDSYRYGFNGKEKDDQLKGEGNSYDFGARMLDPRIGRWFARDPKESKYPNLSPYNAFENNPIVFMDPNGEDAVITVKGNNITVKAVIYIDNSGKNKINVIKAQKDIMKLWGGNHKDSSGKYNIKFDIVVMEKPKSTGPILSSGSIRGNMPDGASYDGTENLVIPQAKGYRSNVHGAGGAYGFWESGKGGAEYAHEVGHMLGLADLYTDAYFDESQRVHYPNGGAPEGDETTISVPYTDDKTELMADSNNEGVKVSKRSIDAIVNFAIKNQKNGKAKINVKTATSVNRRGLAPPTTQEILDLDLPSNFIQGKKPEEPSKTPVKL